VNFLSANSSGNQTVQQFWQTINWDDAAGFGDSDRPWSESVQQYFAAIPWAVVATTAIMPAVSAQPEKATLENFLDDISQFF
jgi:hypothetical protein